MAYKVEADFYHEGLRCVVIMQERGYRCGYAGISKEHPLYGVDYSQKHELLKKTDIENKPIGNRGIFPLFILFIAGLKNDSENLSPEIYFDVHGSITYASNEGDYPVENKDNLWWFGYDCAHSGDAPDLDFMSEERKKYYIPDNGVVRSLDYCINECKSLAEQLSKFMPEGQEA